MKKSLWIVFLLSQIAGAASNCTTPMLPHDDVETREFKNVYDCLGSNNSSLAATTSWTVYSSTLSSFGTTDNTSYWRQEGDMIHVRSSFKSGTLAAATASFTVPSGKAINYSKAPNPVVQTSYFGNLSCIRNAVINRMDVFGDGSTTDTVYMAYRAGGGVGTAYEKSNANNFGDDTDYFTIDFSYPY